MEVTYEEIGDSERSGSCMPEPARPFYVIFIFRYIYISHIVHSRKCEPSESGLLFASKTILVLCLS